MAWAAIREDELAAASGAIDVARFKLAAFVIGAVVAAYAGALDAHLKFFIDPNGAGKTTLLNVLTGHTAADQGHVVLRGEGGNDDDITARRPHEIAARGVARTFQNIRLYRGLTSSENVIAGMHLHRPRRARL